MKTVFTLIDHPNLDYLLVPVISELARVADIAVMVCVYDAGNTRLLDSYGIAYTEDLSVFANFLKKDGQKLLLTGSCDSHEPPHQRGKRLVDACREKGVPSLAVAHASAAMYEGWPRKALSTADTVAVYGRRDHAIYARIRYPGQKLVFTGSPIHDQLFKAVQQAPEPEAGASNGFLEKPRILYSGVDDRRVAKSPERQLAIFKSFFEVMAGHFPDHEILVKPHPGEAFYGSVDLYRKAADVGGVDIRITDPHTFLPPLINQADLIITFSPSVLLEALLAKKSVIYAVPESGPIILACERQGAVILNTTYEHFPARLASAMPAIKKQLANHRSLAPRFIENVAHRWDGRATRRIVHLIETILDNRSRVLEYPERTDFRQHEPPITATGKKGTPGALKGELTMTGSEDAQLHDRAGDPIATLKKVLLTKPDFARIHFELALLLKRAGETDDAYFHFRQAVALNPSLDEDCAGHILEIDREFAPEENLATGVAGNDTVQDQATSAAVYEEACSYADQGQMDLAFERLQEIAVTYPEFPTAHNDLGVLFYQRGDHEQAQTHYEKAVELEPDNPVFRKNLADFYFVVQKRAGDAMAQYVQVLEQDPRDLEALMAIGRVCESIGNPDDARGFYTKILDIEPWNDEARSALDALDSHPVENDPGAGLEQRYAQIQDKVGQVPEAELAQELTSLMSDYPDFAPGYNDLGVLATQMGENDTALGHYKKAVQLDPNNMTFKKNLADLLYFTGKNMEEAIKLYTGILSASPEDLEALLTLGQISRDVGRDEEARVFFRQALDVDPLNQMARDRLDEIGEYGSSSQPRDPSPEGDRETP